MATLAHELRGPLAPLSNMLEIMKGAEGDADLLQRRGTNLKSVLQTMERQLAQLVRLVDDLLDVSRITRGKIQLRKEVVELTQVMALALEANRPFIDERRQVLTAALEPEPVYVEADATRLEQIVSNLLNNASKYTEERGSIWLTAERQGDQAVIRVRDTGIGIPPAMQPRIFDLFVQAERALDRSQGGLGIGLTLVRRLTEMHGGRVTAESQGQDRGATFRVWLPTRDQPFARS